MSYVFDLAGKLGVDVSPFNAGMDQSATKADAAFSLMADSAKTYLGVRGVAGAFKEAVHSANEFGQIVADISAIAEDSQAKISKTLTAMDNIYGRQLVTGNALYEVISSGIRGSLDDQARYVEAAGKTATVIRADLFATADVLTTVSNAYNMETQAVEKLLDSMFVLVREGKAHGDDLARTLGLVINNASEANIAMNDLYAAIAILSRTQSTSQSMIGLNQMINALIKPTLQAQAAARSWGIELSASALESKGLVAVLKELHDKVGGNVEALEKMFGNIRAGRAVLSLTGKQFENYIEVLGEFERGTGAGTAAFKTQTDTAKADFVRMSTQWSKTLTALGGEFEWLTRTVYGLGEAVAGAIGSDKSGTLSLVEDLSALSGGMVKFDEKTHETLKTGSRYILMIGAISKALEMLQTQLHRVSQAMAGMSMSAGAGAAAGVAAAKMAQAAAGKVAPSSAMLQAIAASQASDAYGVGARLRGPNGQFLPQKEAANIFRTELRKQLSAKNLTAGDIRQMAMLNVERASDPITGRLRDDGRWGNAGKFIGKDKALLVEERLLTQAHMQLRKEMTTGKEVASSFHRSLSKADRYLFGITPGARGGRADAFGATSLQRYERRFGRPADANLFGKIANTHFGKMASSFIGTVGGIGMKLAGAWAAIDIGYSIGKAIAERFEFAGKLGNALFGNDKADAKNDADNQKAIRANIDLRLKAAKEMQGLSDLQRREFAIRAGNAQSLEELRNIQEQLNEAIKKNIGERESESRQVANLRSAEEEAAQKLREAKDRQSRPDLYYTQEQLSAIRRKGFGDEELLEVSKDIDRTALAYRPAVTIRADQSDSDVAAASREAQLEFLQKMQIAAYKIMTKPATLDAISKLNTTEAIAGYTQVESAYIKAFIERNKKVAAEAGATSSTTADEQARLAEQAVTSAQMGLDSSTRNRMTYDVNEAVSKIIARREDSMQDATFARLPSLLQGGLSGDENATAQLTRTLADMEAVKTALAALSEERDKLWATPEMRKLSEGAKKIQAANLVDEISKTIVKADELERKALTLTDKVVSEVSEANEKAITKAFKYAGIDEDAMTKAMYARATEILKQRKDVIEKQLSAMKSTNVKALSADRGKSIQTQIEGLEDDLLGVTDRLFELQRGAVQAELAAVNARMQGRQSDYARQAIGIGDYMLGQEADMKQKVSLTAKEISLLKAGTVAQAQAIQAHKEAREELYRHTEAMKDSRAAIRDQALGVIQEMAGNQNRKGVMRNDALYHSLNMMARLGGPQLAAKLSTPTMAMNGPMSYRNAQEAQAQVGMALDSYIIQQKYANANMGKNVENIYTWLKANNAVVIGG